MSSIGIVQTEEMTDFEGHMDDAELEQYLCPNEGSSQPEVSHRAQHTIERSLVS